MGHIEGSLTPPVSDAVSQLGEGLAASRVPPRHQDLPALRGRPLAFLFSYIRRHPAGHLTVLLSVVVRGDCAVSPRSTA